ncbi:MAG: ATP-binding protein [Mariprofundaceae bacterium]
MSQVFIHKRLQRLLAYRSAAAIIVLAVALYYFYPSLPIVHQKLLIFLGLSLPIFITLQWYLLRLKISLVIQLLIQFYLDILWVSFLIFITGGIQSPFVFLFGLIIVAAGTQAHALVVMLIAVLACIFYLASIHGFAWWYGLVLPSSFTLNILMQTSALLLVGGVMAAIARRHMHLEKEQKQAVRQHRRLQELHGQVMASMQEGMLVLDQALYIQDSNQAARKILATGEEPAGLHLDEIWAVPKDLSVFLDHPHQDVFRCEWKTLTRTCLVTTTSLPRDDAAAKWLLTFVDITDVRQLEAQLVEQDKLAAMGRMLAMLAHEIRNPMQTLAQAVDLMRTENAMRQQDIQRIVSEEISRLNRLVSDMLDYVQPFQPKPVEIKMSDLLKSSIEQMDIKCEGVICWHCDIDVLNIDADHFRLVLDNLLHNALAVSSLPKSIHVRMKQSNNHWQLTVEDQGGGIHQDMKTRLFEPFASNKQDGIGLGLATVWQVCRANDWNVDVMDVDGGSCFSIMGKVI